VPIEDFIRENWLPLLGIGIALGSLWTAWSVKRFAHVAILESLDQGIARHDEYGRPTLRISITNTGPGIAKNVRVRVKETFEGPPDDAHPGWWRRPSTTRVVDRLGPDSPITAEIPASGDDLGLINVRWRDGDGRHVVHPSSPPEPIVMFGR
jgi:hypothetical protein